MATVSEYKGSSEDYMQRLPGVKKKMGDFYPEKAQLIQTPVSPYSISIVAGIPLFRTHDSQRDYNALVHDLRQLMPNQFPYENLRTHVALGVLIRNSPGSENNHAYEPKGDKREFYADYLDVFYDINFNAFSLKLNGLCQNGVMLWEPAENPEEVFNIRRQISQGLLEKKAKNPDLFFQTDDNGLPKIDTGIIHSTFLRFADRPELERKFTDYLTVLDEFNDGIADGQLFAEPITVGEIAFIEPRVSREITTRDWYTDEVIARRVPDELRR